MAQYGAVPAEAFIIMTQRMFPPILINMIHDFSWFHRFLVFDDYKSGVDASLSIHLTVLVFS